MRRSRISLALIAAFALAITAPAAPAVAAAGSAPGDAVAQTSAKKGKKGKKRASTCTKKRSKGKGKAKGRKTRAVASATKRGRGKAKRKSCGSAKPKQGAKTPSRDGDDRKQRPSRDPRERREERERERRERRPTPGRAPTAFVPQDGTFSSAAAPGLTLTVSGRGTSARVVYTVASADFDSAVCQTRDVPIDMTTDLSRAGDHAGMTGSKELSPGVNASVLGSIRSDGTFSLSLTVSYPYPPDPTATCGGSRFLEGTLTR